jgi:hypothetical protein
MALDKPVLLYPDLMPITAHPYLVDMDAYKFGILFPELG